MPDGLRQLNDLPANEVEHLLRQCCGASRWVRQMSEARPFGSLADLLAKADQAWQRCGEADWLEAFGAHPKLGTRVSGRDAGKRWAAGEQAGTAAAATSTLEELARLNATYLDRFGFIFILCATGKSADEMLANLRARVDNSRVEELRIAASEQHRITRLRLTKLLAG